MDAHLNIARRVAAELRSGMLVNLGIGIPTRVANYVPPDIKVFFQSENGLIGTVPIPEQGMEHSTLTDAGGRPITALPGASTFDSATSFALIRGGHVDMTVLGGLQVDAAGHLANWMIPGKMVPAWVAQWIWFQAPSAWSSQCNYGQGKIQDRQEVQSATDLGKIGRPH